MPAWPIGALVPVTPVHTWAVSKPLVSSGDACTCSLTDAALQTSARKPFLLVLIWEGREWLKIQLYQTPVALPCTKLPFGPRYRQEVSFPLYMISSRLLLELYLNRKRDTVQPSVLWLSERRCLINGVSCAGAGKPGQWQAAPGRLSCGLSGGLGARRRGDGWSLRGSCREQEWMSWWPAERARAAGLSALEARFCVGTG